MASFLEHLEKNYDTFNMFDGDLNSFKFPDDIIAILTILMKKTNNSYIEKSKANNKNPYIMSDYSLEKDVDGKCYLQVVGADERTILIIRQDSSDFHAYKKMEGRKITESEFMHILDVYQTEKLKKYGISKRFIKDDIPAIDSKAELNTQALIDYYEYLKDYYLESISNKKRFIEPDKQERESYSRNIDSKKIEAQRKNDIIDYELRKKELLKYKPFKIINFVGVKSGEEIDVYVYLHDGFVIAVAEPISGESYTKILNLGLIDPASKDLIADNVQAALEASEEIVMLDDAIIRKGHTTLEVFRKNLEVLFDTNDEQKRFFTDIEASKSVYKR